jgi:ABC-type bacteriocin/lantibiotic exporter with double-glycine peptidase domain
MYVIKNLLSIFDYDTKKSQDGYKGKLDGDIELKDVSFQYKGSEKKWLNNVNIKINYGEKVAIVGKSGHGKTTLIKCLLNLCVAQEGKILFKQIDIHDMSYDCLYKRIGVVMQDSTVFNLSFKENLLIAKSNATEEQIRSIYRKLGLDDFIMSLPQQYNSLIGERGIKISGGQKQRISLARALIKDTDILIFDEATSALDYGSEISINQEIKDLTDKHTMIIVAHRLASVLMCDRVLVIHDGNIVGDGTVEELISTNKYFQDLYADEYNKYVASKKSVINFDKEFNM